jgi:hypothetical protein
MNQLLSMVNPWGRTSDDYPVRFFVAKLDHLLRTANAAADDRRVPWIAGNRGEWPKDRARGVWQNLSCGGASQFLKQP